MKSACAGIFKITDQDHYARVGTGTSPPLFLHSIPPPPSLERTPPPTASGTLLVTSLGVAS